MQPITVVKGSRFRVRALMLACSIVVLTGVMGAFHFSKAKAAVGINEQINYQGRLLTNTGAVVPDGNYNVEFKIYQDGNGVLGGGDETLKWTETRTGGNKVLVKNGYFSIYMGSVTAFGSSVDWNQDTLWLSVNVGGTGGVPTWDGEMSPFTRFSSTPYALNSKALNGLTSGNFVQLAQGVQADASSANSSIFLNKTAGTANILQFQRGGTDVLVLDNSGRLIVNPQTDSTSALTVRNAAASEVQLTVDTTARGAGGGNIVKVGNSTGTDTATTIFQLDSTTADPSSNLTALNGGLFYNSTTNDVKIIENGSIKTLCNNSDGCNARLDQIVAATGNSSINNGANNIVWNWQLSGAESGLTFGENVASAGGGANDQALVAISTLTGSTASPLQITSNSADGGDILFNLANSGDFDIQDGGVSFANFADDGTISLGKSTANSTLNFGIGTGVDTINIGTGATGADVITIGNASTGTNLTFNSGDTDDALVINTNSVTTGTGVQVNATGLTTGNALEVLGPSATNLLTVGRSSDGFLDFARVAVGGGQTRDQFYVNGRINSSWDTLVEDFVGGSINIAADANSNSMVFDEDTECNWITLADNNHSTVRARAGTTPTAGDGCNTSSGGIVGIRKNENPVMEVSQRVSTTANTSAYKVGFTNDALGADSAAVPTNGIYFRKNTTDTTWYCVNRSAGVETGTAINSGVTVSTTVLQRLRIEVENIANDQARFFIDGVQVCGGPIANNIPTVAMGWTVSNSNPVGATATTIDMYLDSIRLWHDDPPGESGALSRGNDPPIQLFDIVDNSDVAEYYLGDPLLLPPGTLVRMSDVEPGRVEKASSPYDPKLIGVIATTPKITLGNYVEGQVVEVALVGRVPTEVTTLGGTEIIRAGDPLTASTIPGVAMKATKAGKIIGYAMHDYFSIDNGSVMVYLSNSQGLGTPFSLEGEANADSQAILTSLVRDIPAQNYSAGLSEIFTDRVVAGLEIITPKVTTDSLALSNIKSVDGQGIDISIGDDEIVAFTSPDGTPLITFDSSGNATFSGQITADKIKANQIEGFEVLTDQISSLSNQVASQSTEPPPGDTEPPAVPSSSGAPVTLGATTVSLDLSVTGALRIGGPSEFSGDSIFHKLVTFVEKTVFRNDVSFEGRVKLNNDTGGFATIKSGETQVRVPFSRDYDNNPVVSVNVGNGKFVQYAYRDLSTTGFTIVLKEPATEQIEFSWIALDINDPRVVNP